MFSRIALAWAVVAQMRCQDRMHGFCWSLWELLGYDDRIPEDMGWLLLERDAPEVARLICQAAVDAFEQPSVLDLGGAARKNAELAAARAKELTA